jgi:2-polyprenyl-3-methyl-5-hydroxy-6-metoxy-1,4-benzoquinol methylase
MPSLKTRQRQPEVMDQPGLDPSLHHGALIGLQRVNRLSGTVRRLWRAIRSLTPTSTNGLRVLDVASGGGDVAIGLAKRAKRESVRAIIEGCDVSGTAVEHAQELASRSGLPGLRFFRLDLLRDPLPADYDVVTCTLFLHHLSDDDAWMALTKMREAARQLVLVDDLLRTRLGYALAWLGGRLLTRSPVVHVDGPLSVAAAFTVDEITQLAEKAGVKSARISRHWPQRFLLSWTRQ